MTRAIVLLADRGFADGKLMKYLRDNLGWHFRIRIKRSFQFQHQGQWCKVSSVQLQPGQAYFTPSVSVGKTKPYPNVYLAFAHDKQSDEDWIIVSDEPTSLQTFAQYRLRFCVEESFLDLKSNGFHLEASRLRDKFALSQLCGVIALTMLFLILQGVQVVAVGKRRQVDAHWQRGMSYLKLGWNWIRQVSPTNGRYRSISVFHTHQTLNLLLPPSDNTMIPSSVNSWFSAAFQLLSFVSQAGGVAANKPITSGQGYSSIAWIPESEGSWALPLRHERITSWESPISKAVWQLKQVCKFLPSRPISLWDSEYGCAPFVLKTAGINADKLMRLRSNLCFWSAPPVYSGRGRPRVHGDKFKLNDSETWIDSAQTIDVNDSKLGLLKIRVWHDLHFRSCAKHPMSLVLVERLKEDGAARVAKPLWLAWVGKQMPTLDEVWRLYLRRFAVDHWYRFLKQRLHWTLPKIATPKQCVRVACPKGIRWSDLMPIITWELWLARDIVSDNPLPWQKSIDKLTPGRIAQSMGGVLARIDTPGKPPKPRGKSPGWSTGQPRQRRITYPIVKKRTFKPRKQAVKSA